MEREGDLRRGLDGMKMSKYKFDIIREVTAADERQSLLSYVFPLMRYHDRWKEIDLAEDEPTPLMEHSFKKGNVYLRDIAPQVYPENFMEPTGAAYAFDDSAKGYIEKSIALCKEKDIPVLLLHLPKMSWSYEQSMMMQAFADENSVDYLDLDRWEYRSQLGLDPSVDYYDQEIVENEYDLSINKYKKTEYVAVEYASTTEIMADLHELEMEITAGLAELEGMI